MAELSEKRKNQIRMGTAAWAEKQRGKGLSQFNFWMTLKQGNAVRQWLQAGGDVSIFSKGDQ